MTKYSLTASKEFIKQMKKLDKFTANHIKMWININLVGTENPRQHGKPLVANLKGKWRYRIGDYRLICEIHDDELVILALEIGHRKNVYDK